MTTLSHDAIRELLGAHALDAVPRDEAIEVDRHLATCPSCRAEVDLFHETAALLGNATAVPPSGLWGRIAGALDVPAPVAASGPALGSPRVAHRRPAVLAAAAAFALVVSLGALALRQGSRLDRMQAMLADRTRAAAALAAFDDNGAREVTLRSGDGHLAVRAVVLPDGAGYLLAGRLPGLPDGRTYQLWRIVDANPVSAGVLGPDPDVVAFHVAGPVTALAITEERVGGVAVPSRTPLVSGLLG